MRLASSSFLLPMLLAGACSLRADSQGLLVRPGCPVISLRPNLDGARMLRSSLKQPRRSVTVTLGGTGESAVMAADLTLMGEESTPGSSPFLAPLKPVSIPFHLVQPEGMHGPLIVELALPSSMTSLFGATVDAVTFRSGEKWKPEGQTTCTVPVGSALLANLR